jgi:hypothetical protein
VFPQSPLPLISYSGWYLVSNISTNIQWYWYNSLITGATNDSLLPFQNGPYTVKYTDSNSCLVTSAITYVSNVSVPEYRVGIRLNVQPNPFHSSFIIAGMDNSGTAFLLNPLGEITGEWEIKKGDNEISTSLLPPGVYFLQVRTSDGVATKKLIKN